MNSYSPLKGRSPSRLFIGTYLHSLLCAFDSHTEGRINDVWIALEQVEAVPPSNAQQQVRMLRVLGDVIQNRLDLASQYMGHAKNLHVQWSLGMSAVVYNVSFTDKSEKFLRGTVILTYSKQTNDVSIRYAYPG